MNRQGLVTAALIAAALASGCASTDGQNRTSSEDDKTYVTGSRIPVKDRTYGNVQSTGDRKSIDDMVRRPGTAGNSAN